MNPRYNTLGFVVVAALIALAILLAASGVFNSDPSAPLVPPSAQPAT